MTKHPFHIVDASPWPITGSVGAFCFTAGIAAYFNKYDQYLIFIGLFIILATIVQWWRDVTREATFQGKHTAKVESGIRLGIVLFILSEVFFFLAFFWAYFHSALSPSIEIGATWPPVGIQGINPFSVPLLNTVVLLRSGVTITWAHHRILEGIWTDTCNAFLATICLGVYFTLLQGFEYKVARFTIADRVYGSCFYLATGFHGFHVIIGTTFISVIYYRHIYFHFSKKHHFGFEASAWYWHFVDVVWIFLFISIYWWGY